MQRQSINASAMSTDVLIQILACGFGLIIGIASVWLPSLIVLGLPAAAMLVYIIMKRPEVALLGILIATASIVFENQLPVISLGISLHVPDFLLIGSFALIVLRALVNPNFKLMDSPLNRPLLIFFSITLLSTLLALFKSTLNYKEAIGPIRIFSYYLTFFIVTNVVRERRQLNLLLNGLFLIATIVAAAMVAQYVVGSSFAIIPGQVQTLSTRDSAFEGVTRIQPPGLSIVLLSFVTILCILVLEKFKPNGWLKISQTGLLGMAFALTFLRSFWAALFMVFSLLVFLLRGYDRQKLLNGGMVIISSLVVILLFIYTIPDSKATGLIDASLNRFGTLFDSDTYRGKDGSLNWRKLENGYAFASIASHPWIGLGVRFTYRPWDTRLDGAHPDPTVVDFRKSIHNGHLLIMLQSGLLGYLSFAWLSAAFLIRGFGSWRRVANPRLKGVVLGLSLVYLVILISTMANGLFMQWNWTPVIGILMGTNEVILTRFRQEI